MSTQPTALQIADRLRDGWGLELRREAEAELRRLHAENERLHQINKSHEMKLSVRGYEIQIEAQRDALLNAVGFLLSNPDNRISRADLNAALAAIAKAEGG